MDLAELAPLDRAVVELAKADRDGGTERIGAAIRTVALAWIKLDEREQACKLHYFHADDDLWRVVAQGVAAGRHGNTTLVPYRRTLTKRGAGHGA